MTHSQMIDRLGMLLTGIEDPEKMARPMRVELLNEASNTVVALIERHYLTELDVYQSNVAVDSSERLVLSDLTSTIWERHNGVDFLRFTGDSGLPVRRMSLEEYQILKEAYYVFTSTDAKWLSRGDFMEIYGGDTSSRYDIFYRKAPTTITDAATAHELSSRIQKIIVGLACEGINDAQYESAVAEIKLLNATKAPTDSNRFPRGLTFDGRRYREADIYWGNILDNTSGGTLEDTL